MKEKWLRIHVNTADGDHIRMNIPVSVVRVCVEHGVDITSNVGKKSALKAVDLKEVLSRVERGETGKLMEVTSKAGDHVEIIAE